jgi:flagellar hook-length control protein FliK
MLAGVASSASATRGTTSASPGLGVRLAEMVETVRTTIEVGARQGTSQMRIALSPASLGGLQIHLTETSNGLVARIVAEHSAAATTLQQASDDLRRSLQSGGLTLLRLDIESSDQRGAANADPRSNYGGSGSRQPDDADLDGASPDGVTSPQPLTTAPPAGSLVNVLA